MNNEKLQLFILNSNENILLKTNFKFTTYMMKIIIKITSFFKYIYVTIYLSYFM